MRVKITPDMICSAPNCTSQVKAKDLCISHYHKLYSVCKKEGCSSRYINKAIPYCQRHHNNPQPKTRPNLAVAERNRLLVQIGQQTMQIEELRLENRRLRDIVESVGFVL